MLMTLLSYYENLTMRGLIFEMKIRAIIYIKMPIRILI